MKLDSGDISSPIHEMMSDPEYGRVIFRVDSFHQMYNTRTAALGTKRRHGYDIYTKSEGSNELHVIKRGCESLKAMSVDLGPDNFERSNV